MAATFTANQQRLLKEIREELKDEIPGDYNTDWNLLRWIKGKGEVKEDVLTALKKHLRVRTVFKLNNFDEVDEDELVKKYAPVGLLGDTGKDESRLIVIEYAGKIDIAGVLKSTQSTRYLSTRYKFLERVLKKMNQIEAKILKPCYMTYIVDLEGLPFDPTLVGVVTGPYRILWEHIGDNYPEMIAQFIVVNAPVFMSTLWSALGPLLPEGSREKVVIPGNDWRRILLDHIAADNLPVEYGGRMVDEQGDTMCRSILHFPPKDFDYVIPEQLYWKPKDGQVNMHDLKEYVVSAGSRLYLSWYVLDEESTMTVHCFADQEFTAAMYFCDDPKSKDIAEWQEIYPHAEYPGVPTINEQSFPCKNVGAYHVKFGNEKAWFMSISVKVKFLFFDKSGKAVEAIPLTEI